MLLYDLAVLRFFLQHARSISIVIDFSGCLRPKE
jgi:hypothetical protein